MIRPLVKQGVDEREISKLDLRLTRILQLYIYLAYWMYGDSVVVTSIAREDTSTHANPPPYRFIDLAILEKGGVEGSRLLASIVNSMVRRSDAKPTAMVHGRVLHTHLQVQPTGG